MDVRCEKCQTEYELDEARLKPGGVTVKCTNCGHMFKIRKRSATNVGAPAVSAELPRSRPVSSKPPQAEPPRKRPDSMLDGDDPTAVNTKAAPPGPLDANDGDGPTVPDRQWLIRLENGEQKSCRELASLQQWIVSGVVTRESLISRTGKTWKRLGDVAELAQYFVIADEARATREAKPTNRPPMKTPAATMLGVGAKQVAGGTIVPDDEDEGRSTGNFKARSSTPPPPPPTRTPVAGAPAVRPPPPTPPPVRPVTEPPPPPVPAKKEPNANAEKSWAAMPDPTGGGRTTAAWASESMPASNPPPAGPQGPFGGKVSAITDEPAFASKSFAGKVRTEPGDERVFSSGPVRRVDEDDEEMFPSRRGSRGGMLLVIVALLVIGAAGAVVYIFAFRKKEVVVAPRQAADAGVALATPDAAAPPADATSVAQPAPTGAATALAVLGGDLEARLRTEIPTTDDPAIKAHLMLRLAQDLDDEAGLVTDKAASDKARKEAKQLVLDAATLAQKTLKATADDPTASLAMAEVLRLQGKPAKEIKRYLDAAMASKDWTRDVALATALVLARDGKLDDAKTALGAADTDAGDVRAKFHLAMIAFTQNKPAEAKPLVEQVLATQPEHAGAKALQARLATLVAKTDPLPPEEHPEHKDAGVAAQNPVIPPTGGGEGYDALIKKANALAESANCAKAIELYQKAIELKPGSVEALTGQGFCHIDAKQFSSAFSKFRAALTISPRYEPALWGIAQAYQQQGRKQDAIDSYKAYLDVYPGSAKAQKQLDRLGAGGTPTPPDPNNGGGSGSAAAPPPPPPPAPTPTPAPDPGTGSGSG